LNLSYDVAIEYFSEMPSRCRGNFAEINFAPKNSRDRSHAFIRYPARNNHLKEFQIGVHIERESMASYPSRNSHSNRRDLFIAHPNASKPLDAPALNPVIRNRANQYFFEVAHVAMNITAIRFEIDDWITNELPGAVVSDIAAASGFVDFD
jgi:hypothetical protein